MRERLGKRHLHRYLLSMRTRHMMSRRSALAGICSSTALACMQPWSLLGGHKPNTIQIGACDWSLGKSSMPEAFDLAKQIGLDGVQVSLGTAANDMRLRSPEAQAEMLAKARSTGVKLASLAIGELNNVPYKSDPRTEQWVRDSVPACKALGVRVVLLAFFGKNDLRDDPVGTKEVIRRLKTVAPLAEKENVILGLESWLSAEQHLEIIDAIGSKAVQVYYDMCNSNDRGYDVCSEIRRLGASRICEVHAKENGTLLGRGKLDFEKVRDALQDIGYKGWIQIEGAIPRGADLVESYKANCAFLRKVWGI